MENDEGLRARVAALEGEVARLNKRLAYMGERVELDGANIASAEEVLDVLVIPAILQIAGDAYRTQLLEWTSLLVSTAAGDEDRRTLLRRRYWQAMVRERQPYHGFDPNGWFPPEPEPGR